jgi:hypothetical protein
MREAVEFHLDGFREHGEPIYIVRSSVAVTHGYAGTRP